MMASLPSRSQWMGELPEWLTRVPLSCLAIPGSHDSATSDLDPALGIAVDQSASIQRLGGTCCGKGIVHRWSKTQNLTVAEQLEAGIRYFDFRVAVHPQTMEFRFVHGLYGEQVIHVLQYIKEFMDRNPSEIVILHFNHFYNMHTTLHNMLLMDIRNLFRYQCVPAPFSTPGYKLWGTTLQALRQTPYRVIVIYHDEETTAPFAEIWNDSWIDMPWPDTNKVSTLTEYLEDTYIDKHRYRNDRLYVWQGVLTTKTSDVLLHPGSNLQGRLSDGATAAFVKWLQSKVPGPQEINICSADMVEKHNFIPTVIGLNNLITEVPPPF